jgi:hypothetical protein
VQRTVKFNLRLNLRIAKALGVDISPVFLALATRWSNNDADLLQALLPPRRVAGSWALPSVAAENAAAAAARDAELEPILRELSHLPAPAAAAEIERRGLGKLSCKTIARAFVSGWRIDDDTSTRSRAGIRCLG